MSDEHLSKLIDLLENDEIINLLEVVDKSDFTRILQLTKTIDREQLWEILKYNKDFAGSIMSNDFISLKKTDKIIEVIKKIKKQTEYSSRDNFYYVIDSKERLLGQVSLRSIFFAKKNETVESILDKIPVRIDSFDDKEEVSNTFKKFGISEAPVVNTSNKIVGVIYYDEIFDVAAEEAHEDFQKIMAIDPFKESYLEAPIKKIVKSRILWLIILLFSATLSQVVIQSLQNVIANSDIRKYFFANAIGSLPVLYAIDSLIPLISGTAGNTGSQSSTTIIRGIAMEHIEESDTFKVIWKEFKIAVYIGGLLIIFNAIRMPIYDLIFNGVKDHNWTLHKYDLLIILAISLSLFFTVCIAQIIGVSLPILIRKFKKDPSVMSAPLITTFIDAFCNGITYAFCIAIFYFIGTR